MAARFLSEPGAVATGLWCRPVEDPVATAPGSDNHVNQTNHFFNLGYGWLCKHCSAEDAERNQQRRAPDITAGADGGVKDRNSQLAIATWTDSTRHVLTCPRCRIEEAIT